MDRLEADDPEQIGPYLLVSRLGEGGMGRVYLGRSVGGRLVAVKVVRPDLADNAEFRARFSHEVAAAQRVSGFYTAAVVDADADPRTGPPWLATAYVPGPSLATAIDSCGPLPAKSLRLLAAGLAEALRAIHRSGMVHRDLKPGNVLLAIDGPRVIDFGIARATDRTHLTRSGTIGTAAFMAPEQAEGHEVTFACDVFAFGVVLAYAATARLPFGEGLPHAVVYRIVHAEPDLDGIAEPHRELIASCLAKDMTQRPTAEDILTAIGFGPDDTVRATTTGWLPPVFTTLVTEYEAHALDTPALPQPSTQRSTQPPTQPPTQTQADHQSLKLPDQDRQTQPAAYPADDAVSPWGTSPPWSTSSPGAKPERGPTSPSPPPTPATAMVAATEQARHPLVTSPVTGQQQPAEVRTGQDRDGAGGQDRNWNQGRTAQVPRPPAPRWRGYLIEPWGIAMSVVLGTISAAVTATMATDDVTWVLATGVLVAAVCYVVTVGMGILTDPAARRSPGADTPPQQPVS